jgi:hypothetical protein
MVLDRLECEIWWMRGDKRKSFPLEGYRQTLLTPEDFPR